MQNCYIKKLEKISVGLSYIGWELNVELPLNGCKYQRGIAAIKKSLEKSIIQFKYGKIHIKLKRLETLTVNSEFL